MAGDIRPRRAPGSDRAAGTRSPRGSRPCSTATRRAPTPRSAERQDAFTAGADGSRSIWLSITGAIPFLGRTPDSVRAIADAGVETARAAEDLSTALSRICPEVSGRWRRRRPGSRSRSWRGSTDAVAQCGSKNGPRPEDASRRRRAASCSPRSPPHVTTPSTSSSDVHRQLVAGTAHPAGAPAFLGADGPRHYFFGASNPAELRGTGGLIGAYAILTIDDGRLSFSDFRPVQSLPTPRGGRGAVPVTRVLGQLRLLPLRPRLLAEHQHDAGLPARGEGDLARLSSRRPGRTLDGVIVADPFALKALMHVTDPVAVGNDGNQPHRAHDRPVRHEPGVRAVRHERRAQAGSRPRRRKRCSTASWPQQGDDHHAAPRAARTPSATVM